MASIVGLQRLPACLKDSLLTGHVNTTSGGHDSDVTRVLFVTLENGTASAFPSNLSLPKESESMSE